MNTQTSRLRVAAWGPNFTPNAWFLLAASVPLGPAVLLTVRGAWPQERPPACDAGGDLCACRQARVISPFGEVNWVSNLCIVGCASMMVGRRNDAVIAVKLSFPYAHSATVSSL